MIPELVEAAEADDGVPGGSDQRFRGRWIQLLIRGSFNNCLFIAAEEAFISSFCSTVAFHQASGTYPRAEISELPSREHLDSI